MQRQKRDCVRLDGIGPVTHLALERCYVAGDAELAEALLSTVVVLLLLLHANIVAWCAYMMKNVNRKVQDNEGKHEKGGGGGGRTDHWGRTERDSQTHTYIHTHTNPPVQ